MNTTLDTLSTRFAIADHVSFSESAPGLPVVEIRTAHASARVSLYGGHVLAWQPTGQKPVIWVSKAALFEPGKAIRGGVPVCWPWFGPLAGQPLHGFVRTRLWTLRDTALDAEGQVIVRLGLSDDADTRAMWDHAFDLELVVTVGQTLTMALVTRNTGAAPFAINQALHTYFGVGDIGQTTVQGLDGCTYVDKVDNFTEKRQSGPVNFIGETDRIYLNTTADSLIVDAAWGRSIRVAKQGSASTVTWNPWVDKEKTMADMASGEHRGMVCVETCNAGSDQVTLSPGDKHVLSACISVL